MEFFGIKPWLTAMVMPPTLGILLMALGGICLLLKNTRARAVLGASLGLAGFAFAWLTACSGFAIWLSQTLLPQVNPIAPQAIAQIFLQTKVQAIVILGGGLEGRNPEYGSPQPNGATLARVRYAAYLARQSGVPLAFTGGIGWSGVDGSVTEAQAVNLWLAENSTLQLKWLESASRDTAENARFITPLLKQSGVSSIALVTQAWHMPRSIKAFATTGLQVLPAPMGFISSSEKTSLQWLPSADGVRDNRYVLREALGLLMGAY